VETLDFILQLDGLCSASSAVIEFVGHLFTLEAHRVSACCGGPARGYLFRRSAWAGFLSNAAD
jgi:hypothetical protein